MKKYKAVPGPREVTVEKGNIQPAFDMFTHMINNEAKRGWRFHSIQQISLNEKAGCLRPQTSYACYMLIFEKDTDNDE